MSTDRENLQKLIKLINNINNDVLNVLNIYYDFSPEISISFLETMKSEKMNKIYKYFYEEYDYFYYGIQEKIVRPYQIEDTYVFSIEEYKFRDLSMVLKTFLSPKKFNKELSIIKQDFVKKHSFVNCSENSHIINIYFYEKEQIWIVECQLLTYNINDILNIRNMINKYAKKEHLQNKKDFIIQDIEEKKEIFEDIKMSAETKKFLKVDENRTLKSDFYPNLIRTGTIGEGSCLFHSILKGLSTEYSNMSETKKQKYVKNLREELSESLTINSYKKLSGGTIATLQFSENVHDILKEFYSFIDNPESYMRVNKFKNILSVFLKNNMVAYEIITSVIDYEKMDNIRGMIFDKCNFDECKEKWYEEASKVFLEELQDLDIEEEKIDICQDKLKFMIDLICDNSFETAYNNYKEELKDCHEWASDHMLQLISDHFDIDIYFIDVNSGKPYQMGGCNDISTGKRKSVIVGWVNETHFENIGVYKKSSKSSDTKGIVKRLFDPTDEVIVNIRKILCPS